MCEDMWYTYTKSLTQQSIGRQSPMLLWPPQQKQEASLVLLEMSTSRAGKRSQQTEGEEGRSAVVEPMPAVTVAAAVGDESHDGKTPVAAGPAVIGGQMRRLAWVAREREQAVCDTICVWFR